MEKQKPVTVDMGEPVLEADKIPVVIKMKYTVKNLKIKAIDKRSF